MASAARTLLGTIRLGLGATALVAPHVLAKRLAPADEPRPALLYALRLFGIRNLVIGRDLLRGDERAIAAAPLIHATDTCAAALLATSGSLPRRRGVLVTALSAGNTVLALLARSR